MLTLEQHESFTALLANAFEAIVTCNPHHGSFMSIREYFEQRGDEHELAVQICEAAGAIWVLHWYANSVGHWTVHAPSYEALVVAVLKDTPFEMHLSNDERNGPRGKMPE